MDAELHEPGGQVSSISKARTPWEIGEFWDTHELTDFDAETEDVTEQIEVELPARPLRVAVDPDLLKEATSAARQRGITLETLVNLAIREALDWRAS